MSNNTMYLDPVSWDLALNSSASLAMATEPWSLAQDAASAIRTFQGEVYYDTTLGVPYWAKVLGVYPKPSVAYMKKLLADAAMGASPDIASVKVFFTSFSNRQLSGQVQVTSVAGVVSIASF